MRRKLKVLIGCEYSAKVRDEFRALGHDAYSCDILPTDGDPRYHIQGDVLKELHWGWDLMIGHPPCTFLGLCGARWCVDHWIKRGGVPVQWHDGSERRRQRDAAVAFFKALWNAPITRICLEQPMSVASTLVCKRTQTIHPWQFGHPENKTTWLWLKGLPPLRPTRDVRRKMKHLPKHIVNRVHYMTPGEDRGHERSRTFEGIAKAMARQWGK